ncbi:CRISPR-associated helicase Cas3' [Thermococcus alcaliphilus]|uniref:CRISPR-associated helicase Cas3' n=1 Tax=Thermococcus alcaliphilus TaxID=139207 RepID=UPI0020918BD5|nr:CRISPR-associated helicase Cas3' [Thermococcus alcaliphilus]MCO6040884.1 CRISPR-associated helicase Cas3' [Thermococcus alcaliphilus]
MGEMERKFKQVTGFTPYMFQKEAIEHILEGYSLIVRAPTGSGKSEMVLLPFIFEINETLPSQMIYSLPNRTLVESIGERARRYASYKKLRVAVHHGKRPESQLFEEDIIVATIDQTAGAYLSVPLSMPKRWGNIFLGTAGSAMLVFDEVHTLHPEKGLLTSVAMSVESAKLGIPFVMMSATLPTNFMKRLKAFAEKKGGRVEIIDVEDEAEIKSRAKRKVWLNAEPLFDNTPLTAKEIEKQAEDVDKLIVVVNQVEKAQQLYRELKPNVDRPIILIHSRFLEEDRSRKEAQIRDIFGKKGKNEAILISTQVIEVGMDISSTKLLTEVSPIDSLIQRAGRVARWGGEGEVVVYGVDKEKRSPYAPYFKELTEATIEALKDVELLDWQTEVKLVDKVLSKTFESYLDPYKFYERLGGLARAVYEGRRSYVEENVREAYSVDVSIFDDVNNLNPDKAWKLKRIRLDFRVLKGKFDRILENGGKIYLVEENFIIDEYSSKYSLTPVCTKEEIQPFEFYVIEGLSYSSELGLLFDGSGNIRKFDIEEKNNETHTSRESKTEKESWVEHSRRTLEFLRTYMLPRYDYPIRVFAKYFDIPKKELVKWIELSVALHDLGKLNIYWQRKAGWKPREDPIAHGFEKKGKLPPHATVSAKALEKVLFSSLDKNIAKAFYLAIAHHHSPGAREFSKFKLLDEWRFQVEKALDNVSDLIDLSKTQTTSNSGKLPVAYSQIPDIQKRNPEYRFYGLVSKILRISDWGATGGGYERILRS